ncbi:phosphodiester glycosidase family protein [Deinococcus pimensis]|uniref:phosphodiester glycosidase family protein n=1 Tax=Deinococcus pimensis TaxID=309888 RepID=UPI0004B4526B|nr:phosphodiester glycosidase family protein [Deinococcus pimensis]
MTLPLLLLVLASVTQAAPAAPTNVVTVKKGETLYRIATRHHLSVERLRQLNGLRGNRILVGQKLRVAPAKPAVAKAPARKVAVKAPVQPAARGAVRHAPVKKSAARPTVKRPVHITRARGVTGPARPAGSSVRLVRGRVLGVPVAIVNVDLRDRRVLVTPILPRAGLGTGGELHAMSRTGAVAVINGGFFHPRTFIPAGDLVVRGRYIARGRINTAVAITPDNRVVVGPTGSVRASGWRGYETVIATGPHVVRAGRLVVTPRAEGYTDAALWGRAARSAIGITSSQRLFFLSTSRKLSLSELARVMQRAGARDAILLDGGTSTGLLWKGHAVVPAGRKVAYGIGVYVNYRGARFQRE